MINKVCIVGILVFLIELSNAYWGPNGHGHHHQHRNYPRPFGNGNNGGQPGSQPSEKYIHPPWWSSQSTNPTYNNENLNNNGNPGPFSKTPQDNGYSTPQPPPPPPTTTTTTTPTPTTPTPTTPTPTTTTTPTPTTPTPTTPPTGRSNTDDCLKSCNVTNEYSPVCGTDNNTYENIGKFECARKCGADIAISKTGLCSAIEGRKSNPDDVLKCVQNCNFKKEFSPACGTNLVTYANNDRLECAKRCGVDVKLDRLTSCQATVDLTNKITKTEVDICTELCPIKHILDPVCGTNNVTYINRGHLECSQKCGHDVRFSKSDYCDRQEVIEQKCPEITTPTPTLPTTEPPKINPSPPIDLQACMQTCSITMEYNPVCATNGITYTNPSFFTCNQFCGVDIKVKKFAPCNSNAQSNIHECVPFNPNHVPTGIDFKHCMNFCAVPLEFNPVCGSNGITYKNSAQLSCAQKCGIDVTMVHNSRCPDQTPTTPEVITSRPTQPETSPITTIPETTQPITSQPVTTRTETSTDYNGIDPNIIFNIFNTTSRPTTTVVTIDSDSEEDIDPRFQSNM